MVFGRILQLALFLSLTITVVNAHIVAWSKGMYCLNGTTPGEDNGNNNAPVSPLFKLKKKDWWMHHINKCDEFPPAPGDFLELPANGNFTVELATNRAFTTLSGGQKVGAFPGPLTGGSAGGLASIAQAAGEEGTFKIGQEGGEDEVPGCIVDPNMHTQNETMASGTAFAISYTSDLSKVTPENLVVFSVLEHTPFRRLATYQVPNLPACPEGGCICTWGWIPNGCGQPNMYFFPYRCKVTGTPGSRPLALPARPPTWCDMNLPQLNSSTVSSSASNSTATAISPFIEISTIQDDERLGPCYRGPKQMLVWNQLEGDNIEVLEGELGEKLGSPGYNEKVGFRSGAQNDIFALDGKLPPETNPPLSPVSVPSLSTSVVSSSRTTSVVAFTLTSSSTLSTASTSVITSSSPHILNTVTTSVITSSSKPLSVPTTSLPSSSTPSMTTIRLVSGIPTLTRTAEDRSTTREASSAVRLVADRRIRLVLTVLSSGLVGLVLSS
ncbi:hypothetical protein E1B28_002165 [Marasmius oreades]|uniref:Uncharacterized protein n=1 Tax=Marasmius oreades TaxID=181124 RepID=A0A9P7RMI0_9AGAR|nr:uncharacterized protein E1B28_002165 [Marasmius oreades]KAG7086202.1 hypothetical protein E1B28_002165 [Marasmius oreades]